MQATAWFQSSCVYVAASAIGPAQPIMNADQDTS